MSGTGPGGGKQSKGSRLRVLVDGAPLDDEAARALWVEFSAHMDANEGDFAGFAKKKGWASVAPEYREGKAVLVVRTGAAAPKGDGQGKKGAPRRKGR